ncbi:MAG: DUF4118 domain-containing protein, partial [Desulfuromonadaceae bacterium]|nr:DUF4118 domain-containing protein [Desulfuromonadaceae bacterium]
MESFNSLIIKTRTSVFFGYLSSICLVILATLLCELLSFFFLPVNLLMIYLLTVLFTALKLGFEPAIAAVSLSGFVYNYLYVSPRFDFNLLDKEYIATYFGLFVTGAVISSLVTKVAER